MKGLIAGLLLAVAAFAADHPQAEISNGPLTAKLHLPDPENGYYRGTRFDWSGVIFSLTHAGHEYFGEWQQSDDPLLHDRITGPVEEFRSREGGLGYDAAPVGGSFLRVGVGMCEKPEEKGFDWRKTYKIVDPGRWTTRRGANWIEFIHEVDDPRSGYGYRYSKRITLAPGRPEMVIDHALENTGREPIETEAYNHNFFVIDGRPTGPEFSVRFPFELTADRDLKGYGAVRGRELTFEREIPAGESMITLLDGYANDPRHHAFAIENSRAKAGVRASTDKPLSKLQFWSPRTTLCPEPFIALEIAPGAADRWTTRYEFYELE